MQQRQGANVDTEVGWKVICIKFTALNIRILYIKLVIEHVQIVVGEVMIRGVGDKLCLLNPFNSWCTCHMSVGICLFTGYSVSMEG